MLKIFHNFVGYNTYVKYRVYGLYSIDKVR